MSASAPALPPAVRQARFLVEGPDDQGVVLSLLQYHGYSAHLDPRNGPIAVSVVGGVTEIPRQFGVALKGSTISHIGIVVDADDNPASRWQSLRSMLQTAGYRSPAMLTANGAVIAETDKKPVGIWLMPNNRDAGTLEHFVSELVPNGNDLWPRAKRIVNALYKSNKLSGPPNVVIKAQIHTWLAWQEEPGRPMGQAITKRYLDPNAQYCQDFGGWLQRLFSA